MPEFTRDETIYVGETYVDVGELEREVTIDISPGEFLDECSEEELDDVLDWFSSETLFEYLKERGATFLLELFNQVLLAAARRRQGDLDMLLGALLAAYDEEDYPRPANVGAITAQPATPVHSPAPAAQITEQHVTSISKETLVRTLFTISQLPDAEFEALPEFVRTNFIPRLNRIVAPAS